MIQYVDSQYNGIIQFTLERSYLFANHFSFLCMTGHTETGVIHDKIIYGALVIISHMFIILLKLFFLIDYL